MVEYGNSPSLNEEWDLVLTDDGDVQTTFEEPSESEELEKDLAFFTAIALDKQRGQPINAVTEAALEGVVRDVVTSDPRVSQVISLQINEIPRQDGYAVDLVIEDNSTNVAGINFTT